MIKMTKLNLFFGYNMLDSFHFRSRTSVHRSQSQLIASNQTILFELVDQFRCFVVASQLYEIDEHRLIQTGLLRESGKERSV